jgi:hypothetical protein
VSKPLRDGTSATRLAVVTWRKSTHSGQLGNCVEVASLDSGDVALRNSRYPSGPALIFNRDEMAAFVAGVKDGEFDDLDRADGEISDDNMAVGFSVDAAGTWPRPFQDRRSWSGLGMTAVAWRGLTDQLGDRRRVVA